MKARIVICLFTSLFLFLFVLNDLAVVVWQYQKHLGEPYDLYSSFGVRAVSAVLVFTVSVSWYVFNSARELEAGWRRASAAQLILSIASIAVFAFIFLGPFGEVRLHVH